MPRLQTICDRKSSQGFATKLFGGLIAWRANKQNTVTTSTTETELLALSQAAKEAIFTRLLTSLKVTLYEDIMRILCDNGQTIRLGVERGSISVEYVRSGEMIADGLTKALQAEKFEIFRRQVGLVDISEKLRERRTKEFQEDDRKRYS